ncbi:hypothetical protein C4K39_1479 [Pseudomonas sessilinigenes]|nr:hypothetical protein C4K39_1479 [Pseudomonas sessilinigenes]
MSAELGKAAETFRNRTLKGQPFANLSASFRGFQASQQRLRRYTPRAKVLSIPP